MTSSDSNKSYLEGAGGEHILVEPLMTEGVPEIPGLTIESIASGLAYTGRYATAADCFYSVAQHCVLLSHNVGDSDELQFQALMHDAEEAFLGDIPTPLKKVLFDECPRFGKIYGDTTCSVLRHFGISEIDPEVLLADRRIFIDELDILISCPKRRIATRNKWPYLLTNRLGIDVGTPWSPDQAKMEFLERYYELAGMRL